MIVEKKHKQWNKIKDIMPKNWLHYLLTQTHYEKSKSCIKTGWRFRPQSPGRLEKTPGIGVAQNAQCPDCR